jgi:hypothetical protein
MTATAAELQNFLWHCEVAALLSAALPATTSTKGHVLNAIRMATYAAVGSKGVRHASYKAREHQASIGLPWDQCGLIREHTIPVSVVCKRVREVLSRLPAGEADATLRNVTSPIAPGLWSPRGLQIAGVVLQGTLMTWLTETEDRRLSAKGLGKRMPPGWKDGHDPFARYAACEIDWAEI